MNTISHSTCKKAERAIWIKVTSQGGDIQTEGLLNWVPSFFWVEGESDAT